MDTHYCTYCDYYSRDHFTGKRIAGSTVYTGSRRQVMSHANVHPLGSPSDMAAPIADRAEYAA